MNKKLTLIITMFICCTLLVSTSYAITEEKTNINYSNKFDDFINLTVEEVWEYLNDTSNGIQFPIDVRTDSEWETEHINTPKPENPKHHEYTDWYDEQVLNEFMSTFEGEEVIIYCRSGSRSVTASNILIDNGFNGVVYNMLGGINAWKAADLPTIGNLPPETPDISGTVNGAAGQIYDFEFISNDPEEEQVFYCVNWSDETGEVCLGPFESGEVIVLSHNFTEQGTYIIKAKARDRFNEESEWGTLEVSMPRALNTNYGDVNNSFSDTTLEISDIRSGIGSVIIDIKNVGDATAESINSIITVTGGIFNGINVEHTCSGCSSCGTTLEPDAIKTENSIEAGFILGIGNIDITASAWADNADEVSVSTTGFVIGPFIIL
jgi:rhodanese-related sulfurtransferase